MVLVQFVLEFFRLSPWIQDHPPRFESKDTLDERATALGADVDSKGVNAIAYGFEIMRDRQTLDLCNLGMHGQYLITLFD